MNMKKLLCLLMALVMVFCLAACGSDGTEAKKDDKDDGKKETVEELVMATNANFPPYEYMEGDEYAGIDIDMAREIAKRLNMELVIENVEFGTIVAGVSTGKYDVGIAGMTVTDERKLEVNFSDSYATGVQVVIVKEGGKVKTLDDLGGKDIMIGVQQDTTGHIYAGDTVENGGYGEDHVTAYLNGADAVAALVSGSVDAVIIDQEPAKEFIKANDGLSILPAEWAVEDYAIAIGKDNDALLTDINKVLKEMKDDGTMASIIAKYIKAE